MIDIYGGNDPRYILNYSAGKAARYLNIPYSTIRSWTVGYNYKVTDGKKDFEPIISVEIKSLALVFPPILLSNDFTLESLLLNLLWTTSVILRKLRKQSVVKPAPLPYDI